MDNSGPVHVLHKLRAFLRLMNAYNPAYFRENTPRSVAFAICATGIIFLIPIFISLGALYLIENNAELRKVVVALPIMFTFGQTDAAFVAILLKYRIINETIDRLQTVVDQRKLKFLQFFFCFFSLIRISSIRTSIL